MDLVLAIHLESQEIKCPKDPKVQVLYKLFRLIIDQPKRNIRKTLFGSGNPTVSTKEKEKPKGWCSEEIQALIQYIGLYWDGAVSNGWPNTKDGQFWECCANAIAETTNLPKRSECTCALYFKICHLLEECERR